MPVNSALLKSEALDVTSNHGLNDFSASNGWLDSLSSRHQLKFTNLHGESAGVSDDVCNQWKEQLPHLCKNYAMEDIWNVDETGIFYIQFPTNLLYRKVKYHMEQRHRH